jgi:hypothetical protein
MDGGIKEELERERQEMIYEWMTEANGPIWVLYYSRTDSGRGEFSFMQRGLDNSHGAGSLVVSCSQHPAHLTALATEL